MGSACGVVEVEGCALVGTFVRARLQYAPTQACRSGGAPLGNDQGWNAAARTRAGSYQQRRQYYDKHRYGADDRERIVVVVKLMMLRVRGGVLQPSMRNTYRLYILQDC